jgi:hypothetical protein
MSIGTIKQGLLKQNTIEKQLFIQKSPGFGPIKKPGLNTAGL